FTSSVSLVFSCFTAPPPTQIYTLSLHDALPILDLMNDWGLNFPSIPEAIEALDSDAFNDQGIIDKSQYGVIVICESEKDQQQILDRKSTRLNSSHVKISYAVFCLKKKKKNRPQK